MKALFLVGLLISCISFTAHSQSEIPKSLGIGVLLVSSPDSVNAIEKPDKPGGYLSWENYQDYPEHSGKFWVQFGITCLKDSLGWYTVQAKPFFIVDVNGESIKKDTTEIRYIKESKHTEFVSWKDFLPGKYLYSFTGNLYKDKITKASPECNFVGCLYCVQIVGEWMEVRPPDNSDCSQMMNEKCLQIGRAHV